jgi:outer membrane protein OmpA-like peptidoglycan-associated protein
MNSAPRLFDRACAIGALVLFLGACSTGTVVLLPEKDAHPTAVVVTQGDRQAVLDQPYAAATQTPLGPRAYTSSAQEVQALAGLALAAQPPRPAQFTLYFVEGKDELTDESKQIVEGVFAEISGRPVPDLLVIGYTDTVGNDQANDALSRQRADTIRAALLERGVVADNVVAVGRGKRELLIQTADGVAEARNRRVVIIVR